MGVSGGLSIMVHGLRLLLEQHGDFVVVRIDFRNAYNEVDRRRAFDVIAGDPSLADMVPLLHALYASEGLIFTGEGERLFAGLRAGDSSTGFGQGAPLSSAAFCLAIHRFVVELDAALQPSGGWRARTRTRRSTRTATGRGPGPAAGSGVREGASGGV